MPLNVVIYKILYICITIKNLSLASLFSVQCKNLHEIRKNTEAMMGLGDRLFVQRFMVMLSESYRRLVLAARVFEAVILVSRAEFTITWFT